jgi:hypothetical protein
MSLQCSVCKKLLNTGNLICYRDEKFCPGECFEQVIALDRNMQLYSIIERLPSKRAKMKERIAALDISIVSRETVQEVPATPVTPVAPITPVAPVAPITPVASYSTTCDRMTLDSNGVIVPKKVDSEVSAYGWLEDMFFG